MSKAVSLAASPGRSGMVPPSFQESADLAVLTEPVSPPPIANQPIEMKEAPETPRSNKSGVICRLEAASPGYRVGEPLELVLTFENTSAGAIRVPAAMTVVDGTARFQVMDPKWNVLSHPTTRVAHPATVELQPGARLTLRIVINGAGGYRITGPGTYHVVFLGTEIGLTNSNSITLYLDP